MFKSYKCTFKQMSVGIARLKKRLDYTGGSLDGRIIRDKLLSLKSALYSSYQSGTAILSDGRAFKCLMNPDKLTEDLEQKEISIPFKDKCLDTGLVEEIGMKSGDIFEWKEDKSYWMVYLPVPEEKAYFRASVKKCQEELEIGDKKYWAHVRGPVEQTLDWTEKEGVFFNKLSYTLILTISKTEETKDLFKRFAKVKIKGRNWEVQASDDFSLENIITVYLKEDYSNEIEEEYNKEQAEKIPEEIPPREDEVYIEGDSVVYPFDYKVYCIKNAEGGKWKISDSKKAIIRAQVGNEVEVEIVSARSGKFDLIYIRENEDDVVLHITIDSL